MRGDPDVALIDAMLRPPPLAQARESLEFWQRRRRSLPFYRRRARREADEMLRRAHAQLAAALDVRYGRGLPGLVRKLLAREPTAWRGLGQQAWATTWSLVPRRAVVAVAGAVFASVVLSAAAVVALVVLAFQAA
jgi:hypothetical protein